MFWNDDDESGSASPANETIDFVFQLVGSTLPQEYISAFANSLRDQAQWWNENDNLSFHMNIAGEEGNGWFRGDDPDDVIYISRRNLLVVRGSRSMADVIQQLAGVELVLMKQAEQQKKQPGQQQHQQQIAQNNVQHTVRLKHKHNKEIKPSPTLYSRFVVCGDQEEGEFLNEVVRYLRGLNVNCKKLLCGKQRKINIADTQVNTCSLMLEGLNKDDSILLQSRGIGDFQKYGCGVLIPHKSLSQD